MYEDSWDKVRYRRTWTHRTVFACMKTRGTSFHIVGHGLIGHRRTWKDSWDMVGWKAISEVLLIDMHV